MHPLLAGLIGAAIALAVVIFVVMVQRGRADLREIERLQRPPRASREAAEAISALPMGALLVGPHDEILAGNEAAFELGLARGSRLGFSQLLEQVRETRVSGQRFIGELLHQGDSRELLVRIVAFHNDSVLVLGEDGAERKRAETMRRDFVANVSHELKTPIGAISVLAEAIEAAVDDAEAVGCFAARLRMESTRLSELVGQIIGLSRIQSPHPSLERELVSVDEVIGEAVSRSRERAEQRSVSLLLARTADLHVQGDRWQLVDAVTNLVQNAINYSDEQARVAVSVQSVVSEGKRFVDIRVSDNGIGIKAEDQERIFERFYRVDYGRSREMGGTGLGLSVVRHIALAHGGSVRVWSCPGQGSTFTLRLPAHDPERSETEEKRL